MSRPLAIDLFTGLHGWSAGLVAEGWRVIGFDLEDMCAQFGQPRPQHVQLVIQNVLTLHGSQFKSADLIVASPPCQAYSWMAMPWSLAKEKAAAIRADESGKLLDDLNQLFNACFRIQHEACEAAGRHIPMVVENVRGAQPWVGRSRWQYGSFALWGDVPALMPITSRVIKVPTMGAGWYPPDHPKHVPGLGFNTQEHTKNNGGSWFNVAHNTESGKGNNPVTNPAEHGLILRKDGKPHTHQLDQGEAVKHHGSGAAWFDTGLAGMPSKSKGRKMASAMIAKIPIALARFIAKTYHPKNDPNRMSDETNADRDRPAVWPMENKARISAEK